MRCTSLFAVLALPALLTACGSDPDAAQYGPEPKLPDRQRGLLPSMEIANPAQWGDQQPMVPQGYTITRSEEHTSELQSLMRISYAVFCLKKKKTLQHDTIT